MPGVVLLWSLLAMPVFAFAIMPAAAAPGVPTAGSATSPLWGAAQIARAMGAGPSSTSRPDLRADRLDLPAISTLPNVPAETGSFPVNSTPITADPLTPTHLMSAGNDYNCGSFLGFYNSDDGGADWRQSCMPFAGSGACGDPTLAYDRLGAAYAMGIANCGTASGNAVYQRSIDNGVTWGSVLPAFGSLMGGAVDKPWMEIDTNLGSPFLNCIYVSWTDVDVALAKTRITVSHSCVGGPWIPSVVAPAQTAPAIDQFTDLAIDDAGIVYLTWMHCSVAGPVGGNCADTDVDMMFSKSLNGGLTWSSPTPFGGAHLTPDTADCYYGCFPASSEPLSNVPSIDYDNSTGNLCAAFFDYPEPSDANRHSEANYICSTNGGVTWGNQIPIATAASQAWIWLSMNDAGRLAISFLYSRDGVEGTYSAGAVVLKDGFTFLFMKLSAGPSVPFADDGFGGTFLGDYTGAIWTGNTLHVAWMDARNGGPSSDATGGLAS
jgi:hypothetical protein